MKKVASPCGLATYHAEGKGNGPLEAAAWLEKWLEDDAGDKHSLGLVAVRIAGQKMVDLGPNIPAV